MLTAGHVCAQLADANFIFPSQRGFSVLHGVVAMQDGERWRGMYDFGFVLLDEATAHELQHFFVFAEPKHVDVNEYPLEGDWYSFGGFPYRKGERRGKEISTPLVSYHLQATAKDRYISLGVNPYSHIVCEFDRKRYRVGDGRCSTAPLPHGISGGPIINYTKEVDPRFEPTKRKLAGICTEYRPHLNLLIGVRIAGFVQAIINSFPELTSEFEEILFLV